MSNQDEEFNFEDIETIIYIPDLAVYGSIVTYGAWASTVNYFLDGFSYTVEMPNDEFEIVEDIGVGFVEEEQIDLGYPEEDL